MTFKEYQYKRPEIDEVEQDTNHRTAEGSSQEKNA